MKRITISALAFSGIVFLNSCGTTKSAETNTEQAQTEQAVVKADPVKEEGINLSYMDTSVRAQDDFFSYVNGNWVKTAEIPSDKARAKETA